jgi:hypothetical protein
MNGTITITRSDKVTIHTYTSPPEGWLVNTHILEGPTKLVIFDGQLVNACADEAASGAISVGPQTFDGARLEFREYPHGESDVQLVALLPEQRVMLAFDLVFAPRDHAFTLAGHFDDWVTILETLKTMPGYDTIVIGHDTPTDPSAFEATIAYLKRAKEIHAGSKDGQSYASALKAAFPDRAQPAWVDFSGMVLYGAQPAI